MLNYVKEDLKLLNMKKVPLYKFSPNSPLVFEVEKELTVEEKIQFIDSQRDGIASYLLDLFERWEQEKDDLPQDNYGRPKTVSKKAWLRKNDNRNIINRTYDIGTYYLFQTKFNYMGVICKGHGLQKLLYTDKIIAEQWYHDLLEILYREEKLYFYEIDPYSIKLKKVKDYCEKYRIDFGFEELNDILWNNKTDISEKRLDIYIAAFQDLEQSIKNIENKLHDTLSLEMNE